MGEKAEVPGVLTIPASGITVMNGLRAATVREDQKLVYMGVLPGGACAMPGHGGIGFSLL